MKKRTGKWSPGRIRRVIHVDSKSSSTFEGPLPRKGIPNQKNDGLLPGPAGLLGLATITPTFILGYPGGLDGAPAPR